MARFALIFVAFLMLACPRSAKKAATRLPTTTEAVLAALTKQRLLYHTLAWRAQATYTGERRQNFSLRVHVQADTLLWASAGLMGFEGARCLLRKDSAFVLMRLQKQLYRGPLDSLWQSLPLAFSDVVDLLIGRWPLGLSKSLWRWEAQAAQLETTYRGLPIRVSLDPQTMQILRWQVQTPNGQTLELRYTWQDPLYPAQVEVLLPSGEQLRLHYTDFRINPTDLSFPMSWPADVAILPLGDLWR